MFVNQRLDLMGVVLAAALSVAGVPLPARAADVAEARFQAADTPRARTDGDAKAQALLDLVSWEPAAFEVRCTSTPGLAYDALVRFDSPMPSGKRWVDEVVLVWYAARGVDGKALEAPAVLMVHTLQPNMLIADQIARVFARRGLHVFVLQLPGYGHRWEGPGNFPGVTALKHGRQAVADCLRARDAIAVLPNIKPGPIALQGTSLGGFVAATAGAIDGRDSRGDIRGGKREISRGFDPVVLLISGGDGYGTLMNGRFDAMFLRLALERQGYRGAALRKLLEPVEPLNVAHRLDPRRTWLISARDDVTIPRASSDALADAIGLDDDHRPWLSTNHYTTLVLLPSVAQYMADIILGKEAGPITAPAAAATRPSAPYSP
jgi:hypothetical protein